MTPPVEVLTPMTSECDLTGNRVIAVVIRLAYNKVILEQGAPYSVWLVSLEEKRHWADTRGKDAMWGTEALQLRASPGTREYQGLMSPLEARRRRARILPYRFHRKQRPDTLILDFELWDNCETINSLLLEASQLILCYSSPEKL